MGTNIASRIDHAVREQHARRPARGHLGASSIGSRCVRQVWYGFRWAYQQQHLGRMLRLFQRGHDEEHNLNRYLRLAGYEIRDYSQRLMYHPPTDDYVCWDWERSPDHQDQFDMTCEDVSESRAHIERATAMGQGPKQWGFRGDTGMHGGGQQGSHSDPTMSHFGGSCDGKIRGPGLPEGWGLLEEKTHNDKSFKALSEKGVLTSKPGHWVQMQIYMHYLGLEWALYLAVNKNDDSLYDEVVPYRPEVAGQYVDTAKRVIESVDAPKRLTEDPSWFECKFCAFREICHYDESPMKNCRSCAFSRPVEDGKWFCSKYYQQLPEDFIPKGCDEWAGVK